MLCVYVLSLSHVAQSLAFLTYFFPKSSCRKGADKLEAKPANEGTYYDERL